ncbi:MAG: 50S ribosomal protein L11 methyltransferase [Oscillospiraceae bacterium]|nr:50S ribosomal protein L11 methyltransferase [Oscillospiraceae bacterium]
MEWFEISVDAPSGGAEALCTLLEDLGVGGLVIEDEKDITDFLRESGRFWDAVDEGFQSAMKGVCRVKFYLPADGEGEKTLAELTPELNAAGYVPGKRLLRDEDWENNWKQYYRPLPVGERLLILPVWERETPAEGRVPLLLDPGVIFGTGAHPSTRMCLEALEPLAPAAEQVLDLGCGSGILAIAALLLGAGEALGCDIDPAVPRVAGENAALNGVEARLAVLVGDAAEDPALRASIGSRDYDLIFLNIVADVILQLLPDIPRWLRPGGTLIVSGVIHGREEEVAAALAAEGFRFRSRREGDWHSFVCTGGDGI